MSKKVFWRTASGKLIDIDTMSESHLRNALKLAVRMLEEEDEEGFSSEHEAAKFAEREWEWK